MCGSSIAWFAVRSSTRAASHGWYGSPPGMSMPMLMLCREKLASRTGHVRDGGMSLSSSLTGSVPRMTQAGSAVIHTPDRSGVAVGQSRSRRRQIDLPARGARRSGSRIPEPLGAQRSGCANQRR